MSERQLYLDRIRELKQDLKGELEGSKFVKEVEPFMLREAMIMLERVESYLSGYLQVDKFRGN